VLHGSGEAGPYQNVKLIFVMRSYWKELQFKYVKRRPTVSVQLWHQTSFLSNSLNNYSKMAKMFSLSPDGRRFLSADGGQQLLHQGAA